MAQTLADDWLEVTEIWLSGGQAAFDYTCADDGMFSVPDGWANEPGHLALLDLKIYLTDVLRAARASVPPSQWEHWCEVRLEHLPDRTPPVFVDSKVMYYDRFHRR